MCSCQGICLLFAVILPSRLAKINRKGFRGTCCSEHNHFPKGGDEKFICSGVSMSLRVIFCYKADMDVLNMHNLGEWDYLPSTV